MEKKRHHQQQHHDGEEHHQQHRVYPQRWRVLATVAALNVGINTLMLSYSSVAADAAK